MPLDADRLELPSLRSLAVGYAAYVVVGWALLCLPIAHTSQVSALDHLFTAASAVSTTGLATVGTPATYTRFGQVVVLGLIQLGGLGYMTLGSFAVIGRTGHLPLPRQRVARVSFHLPEGLSVERFLARVVGFALCIEGAVALALFVRFRSLGVEHALWQAVFHSVSAFCTAGFSLFDQGLVEVANDPWVVGLVIFASLCGALGFIVLGDVLARVRAGAPLSLTSRVIVRFTLVTTLATTVGLFLFEPMLAAGPLWQRWLHALFQACTALTTVGFNTLDIGAMGMASVPLMLVAMVVGASPSGTGGGLKSTTVQALLGIARASLRGEADVVMQGQRLALARLQAAVSGAVVYVVTLLVGVQLLALTETAPLVDLAFEACSAIGTVGLSRGVTGDLSEMGKGIVIGLMFVGRMGPLATVLVLMHLDDAMDDGQDLAI